VDFSTQRLFPRPFYPQILLQSHIKNDVLVGEWDLPDTLLEQLNKIASYETDYLTGFINDNYKGILEDVEL
jgi:hypothetical protein